MAWPAPLIEEVIADSGADPAVEMTGEESFLASFGQNHLLHASLAGTGHIEALRALDGHAHVPHLVAWGQVSDASWTIESRIDGRIPRRIGRDLALDIVAFCASLPTREERAAAPFEDLGLLRARVPGRETTWTLAEAKMQIELPELAVARHGDMTRAAIRMHRHRLTGVVGWEHWHHSGAPGADLLDVFAFDASRPLGDIARDRLWDGERFRSATRLYWQSLGLSMSSTTLDAAGVAWWIGRLARDLDRHPQLASNRRWLEDNVDGAAACLV